ncbi:D-glucuronyl C5-epimerase family protein [Streptomyces sp. NPDC050504]|uniref:D-glucuronyl C5-epimerase family protein n=1 Tax=Streptomyces sp. NPDC050504 TaxID=3365618 RepID=UPI00378D9905
MRISGPGATPVDRRRLFKLTGAMAAGLAVAGHGAASAAARTSPANEVFVGATGPSLPTIPVTPLPDPLLEGTASAPAAAPHIPYASPAAPSAAAAKAPRVPEKLPFAFKRNGYTCKDVPDAMRPWRDRLAPYVDKAAHDAQGVRMYKLDGKLYEHPVGQAQFGLENLATYRVGGDAFYLQRAKAQADRLVAKRIEKDGAWYFPYPFNWKSPSHGLNYKAPWYSGMAQGEALSLFSQLALLDVLPEAERAAWKLAADGTFASLLRVATVKPWVINKDAAGFLWIQEYPQEPVPKSDYTFNGYMFAALGLWDYHRLTANKLAEQLFDGALTTLNQYFSGLRNKNWYSFYCQVHRAPTDHYHVIHIDLLRQLHWLSGNIRFAYLSEVLMDDYPYPGLGKVGTVQLAAGRHVFYDFDDNGAVRSSKTVQLNSPSTAPTARRVRIKGRGIHYLVSAGRLKGLYVAESYPRCYLAGEWFRAEYLPQRKATFPAGVSITLHKIKDTGKVTASKTVRFAKPSVASFDRRSVVNGRTMIRISAGSLTDYWAPVPQVATDRA